MPSEMSFLDPFTGFNLIDERYQDEMEISNVDLTLSVFHEMKGRREDDEERAGITAGDESESESYAKMESGFNLISLESKIGGAVFHNDSDLILKIPSFLREASIETIFTRPLNCRSFSCHLLATEIPSVHLKFHSHSCTINVQSSTFL
jgi:hypothetical protein